MKLGLNLAVFSDRDLESALLRCVELGIDTVELNLDSHNCSLHKNTLSDIGKLKAIKQQIVENGLEISAIGNHSDTQLIGGPHHQDTDTFYQGSKNEKIEYGKDQLISAARIASQLEVRTVIGFTGCEDWSRWFTWPDPEGWEKMLPEFIDNWSTLLDKMGELGVRFAHEPHPKQLVYDLETAVKVNLAFDNRPEWGYNLDAANISLSGVNPAAFAQSLPDKIFHVHAKDLEHVEHNFSHSGFQSHTPWNNPKRGTRFRIPGWGDINWKSFISELQLIGYKGPLSIEHEDPIFSRDEGVEKAVEFLKPLIIRNAMQSRWW